MEVQCPHCDAYFDAWVVKRSGPCPRCGEPLSPGEPAKEETPAEPSAVEPAITPAEADTGDADPKDIPPPEKRPGPESNPPPARRPHRIPAIPIAVGILLCATTAWYVTRPGHLKLTVSPAHATVRVDGTRMPLQSGALSGPLANGTHDLHVTCDGWAPLRETIAIHRGRTTTRQVNLRSHSGLLRVSADHLPAELTLTYALDGATAMGRISGETRRIEGVPLPATLEIPMGDYQVLVTKQGFRATPVDVHVPGRRELIPVTVPLKDEMGTISVRGHQPGLVMEARLPGTTNLVATCGPGESCRMPAGDYNLVFRGSQTPDLYWPATTCTRVVTRQQTTLSVHLETRSIWRLKTDGTVNGGVSLADLNADLQPDAVFGSSDRRVYAVDGRNGEALWSMNVGSAVAAPVVLTNLDSDGTPDCLLTTTAGSVCALAGTDGHFLWQVRVGDPHPSRSATAADLDGDGLTDYVVASAGASGHVVRVLSGPSGDDVWRYATTQDVTGVQLVMDADEDGTPDVAVLPHEPRPRVLSGKTGKLLAAVQPTPATVEPEVRLPAGMTADGPIAITDLDRDGIGDAVVASAGIVHALSGQPRLARGLFTGKKIDRVIVTHIDGDDIPEVLVVDSDAGISAFAGSDGRLLAAGDVRLTEPAGQQPADLDGKPPLEQLTVTDKGQVVATTPGQGSATGWTFKPMGKARVLPTPADLDGDGNEDVLIASDKGWLHAVDGVSGDMRWTTYLGGRDPHRVAAGDLNGDGADDAVVALPDVGLFAFSGRDGSLLWSSSASCAICLSPILADMNGDGRLDVIAADSDGIVQIFDGAAWRRRDEPAPAWSVGGAKRMSPLPAAAPPGCQPHEIVWQVGGAVVSK